MKCTHINNLLSEYIDGMLPERDRDSVRDHLAGCAACRETYESMSAIVSHMRQVETVPEPDDFLEKVTARIEAGTTVGWRFRRLLSPSRIKLPLGLAGAAAAVLIIVYAAGFLNNRDTFEFTVSLEGPRNGSVREKKSRGRTGDSREKSKRGSADAAALHAVIDSLNGTVTESSFRDGTGILTLLKIEIEASRYETLLQKCEDLGILLESSGAMPDADDDPVTVIITIRYPEKAP